MSGKIKFTACPETPWLTSKNDPTKTPILKGKFNVDLKQNSNLNNLKDQFNIHVPSLLKKKSCVESNSKIID